MKYAKDECTLLVIGMIVLIGSQIGSFALPAYIGLALNAMEHKEYDKIKT
jgi:hypothetical protein